MGKAIRESSFGKRLIKSSKLRKSFRRSFISTWMGESTELGMYARSSKTRVTSVSEKPHAQTVAWSYDMEGHAQKCVERYCEPANKKVKQLSKLSHPCLDDHQVKQEQLESVGELSEVRSQIVMKCSCLARIGRPDILWSVNNLARSVTKWTHVTDFGQADFLHSSH